MANVVLIHSAYGLRSAVLADAQRWRDAGHDVVTPDLYEGAVYDDLDEGMDTKDTIGMDELLRRADQATGDVGPGAVYVGWSMGSVVAALLAGTRDAAGLVLLGGDWIGEDGVVVPTQLHAADDDEWVEEDLVDEAARAGAEVFRYGGGHIFADPDLPDYDEPSADLMHDRVLAFLAHR